MKVALLAGGIVLSLLVWALLRIFWAPYWIPSGSMKPTLLIGDYIAVPTKNSVARPRRGEVYVFRHPVTGATLVARLIGVAGDTIQMKNGSVILNGTPLPQEPIEDFAEVFDFQGPSSNPPICANGVIGVGQMCIKFQFVETLPDGTRYRTLDVGTSQLDNTGIFTVPAEQLFFLGDNRDNSTDSRVPPGMRGVGFVPVANLIGQPDFVVFSANGPALWQFGTWRADRFLKTIW